jgi:hypothetical protein
MQWGVVPFAEQATAPRVLIAEDLHSHARPPAVAVSQAYGPLSVVLRVVNEAFGTRA